MRICKAQLRLVKPQGEDLQGTAEACSSLKPETSEDLQGPARLNCLKLNPQLPRLWLQFVL